MSPSTVALFVPVVLVVVLIVGALLAGRRGYPVGGDVVVRCLAGHLFTTIWLPGASLKAIRLGWWRLQWCPVGEHWTFVAPVRNTDLTDAERRAAGQHRDARIP